MSKWNAASDAEMAQVKRLLFIMSVQKFPGSFYDGPSESKEIQFQADMISVIFPREPDTAETL